MITNKKSEEFKTFINSKLTQSVKGYKRQLEKVTSNVKMLQQHVSNLKRENSVLQDKVKMCRQEFDSRCGNSEQYSRRLCLRVKHKKK